MAKSFRLALAILNLPSGKNPGTSLRQQFRVIQKYSFKKKIKAIKYLGLSRAQLAQDLFIILELDFKTEGFFVEFGASDGITLSNTFMLEKSFNWNGVLAEPGISWHNDLAKNRSTTFSTKAVWGTSGEKLEFEEYSMGELNTLRVSKDNDGNSQFRNSIKSYIVETISLSDLLKTYNAPNKIDAVIIDTEGSELDILKNFKFDDFQIQILIVEHNYSPSADLINQIVIDNGYRRLHSDISQWDYWYVKQDKAVGPVIK